MKTDLTAVSKRGWHTLVTAHKVALVAIFVVLITIVCLSLYVIPQLYTDYQQEERIRAADKGDYSPLLTQTARTALPIIKEIEKYHASHDRWPSTPELRKALNDARRFKYAEELLGNSVMIGDSGIAWNYLPLSDDPSRFSLIRQIGDEDGVQYDYNQGREHWYHHTEVHDIPVRLLP